MMPTLFRIFSLSTILKFVAKITLFGFAQLRVNLIASVFVLTENVLEQLSPKIDNIFIFIYVLTIFR
jgi:hypothetical protein